MTITIHSDLTTQLQAGMIVTCQLGNPTDGDWAPAAPVLLLHTDVSFFGDVQFTGLYKKNENDWRLAQYVQTHRTRDLYVNKTGLDIGIAYCTSSVRMDEDHKSCDQFTEHQNKMLEHALRIHSEMVEALPVTQRYVHDQPIAA